MIDEFRMNVHVGVLGIEQELQIVFASHLENINNIKKRINK